MDREQAIKFLTEDCVFSDPLSPFAAEEIWQSHKIVVDNLPPEEPAASKPALSAEDLRAARKFRDRYPAAVGIVDFVRLNPRDLVVHQLWIATDISYGYREKVRPDHWLDTALLDPPSNPRLRSGSAGGNDIIFDLPHSEFFLTVPPQPNTMRISEADGFVTVALHADRALLLRGYHRTFACAEWNAPEGALFAVSNQLASIGSMADEVLRMMSGPRPPRMSDFFDDRFALAVTLRRRRYRMRIRCEVVEADFEEEQSSFEDLFAAAVRHHRASRIDSAVALYDRALLLKPESVDAHNNLGVALSAHGRIDEAVTHYESALALNPGHAGVHNNLGIALAAQGRMDQAAAQHERALAIDPDYPEAHVELGNVLKYQGRFDDAAARYGRAIAARPDYAEAHLMRAEVKTLHHGDAEMSALEALAARDDLSADKALIIHFALGKALEDCGDYARAFEHLRKGNELKRRLTDYDEPGVGRLFERIAALFDRNRLDRFQGAGDPSTTPIFVVGMPRSGSTLIEQILASHPQVRAAGELRDLEEAERRVFRAGARPVPFPEFVSTMDSAALLRLGQAYLSRLPALADGQVRVVDKMPANFLKIGLIRLMLPNARILHTMRDPVDTCVSCYSRLFDSSQPFTYDLAELARYYRLYSELMSHWRSVLPRGAMLDVSYEEVVDDLEGQARRMIEYCGLPWDDRCLDFHKTSRPVRTASAAQVRQPLFRSSLQRWRKYEAGLGPLLRELGDLGSVF
jgi:tetratricopeptide (TPR) repeat protein